MPKLFSDEQMEQVRSITLLDYLQSHESFNITIRERYNEIRLKDHDSFILTISNDLFDWKSKKIGGKGALDYLIKVRNYDFKEAVYMLLPNGSLNLDYSQKPAYTAKIDKEKKRKPFVLPPKSNNNDTAIQYLSDRGIDKDIINDCLNDCSIYQTIFHSEKLNRNFANVVFVGFDWSVSHETEKKPMFACIRSTFGNIKQDVAGSNKAYGFLLRTDETTNTSKTVSVFESPIDVLSGATLAKTKYRESYKNIHRLSLGGVSDLSLKQFLESFPKVSIINLCLDNDEAGRNACESISKMLGSLGRANGKQFKVNIIPPKLGKDYNEMLLNNKQYKTFDRR